MSQTAFQFDWESAVPVDEQPPESAPMQPAAEPAAMEFDWQTATPVEEFDAASAQPLADHEVKAIEEENYRRVDYVMTPEEFSGYWQRRKAEDNEVGRFINGLAQGAAGMVGMLPEAANEIVGALKRGVTDPVGQAKQNIQTGSEIVRKAGINLVQLYDWVSGKVDDLSTSSKRAEAVNAGIRAQLQADGRLTGNREQDEQIYQAALVEARRSGAYDPTPIEAEEDEQKAYERYVREKSLERDLANVSQFTSGGSQMSSPTSAETYQITDEQPLQTVSQIGSMVVDPVNLVPLGAGALSKARVLRRMAKLSEAPLKGIQRGAEGLADVAERIEFGITSRVQDITGLTPKQQAVGGAAAAGAAIYADQVGGGNSLTKAVTLVGGILPALRYGGGFIRKVGGAAGGAATVVREAGVGGLGAARAEAAAGLADNAAIPERYRRHFRGYVEGTDSTLKRVAQDADNPEMLRRLARLGDRAGVTQAARLADDAVSGAVTAGIVGTPFAALQPDAERAGEVMGGIMALGGLGGVAGGMARRRSPDVVDADIARMFADVQAVGGNVDAFARLPHQSLDKLASMQGVLAGKVDFIPLAGDEYRMNADIAQNAGETTAGLFIDKDSSNRARVFINMDAKRGTETIAPHEIGHAILTSNILDGQPRNDLRNLVNQQYGQDGVAVRGREYVARLIDNDIKANATGEAVADAATRERLVNERFEELSQRSIEKGQDPLDWARDEIIAETFASDAPAIDFRAIRRDAMFPRLAESMLSAGGRVLEMFGANISSTGRLLDNPSVLFRDNPLFQDRIMQKRVREYIRSYDQFLAGLEEAGSAAPKGVELARSNNPADIGRSTHVKLRDEGRGVLENDFLFQKPDGTYSFKPQKLINQTEASRAAQIKTLYDARKFVPVNSTEFGKRKVNGRETIGGPVLPPQFDLFTHFPKHVREFARAMEQGRAEGGSWDIDYNAIGTGSSGRYRITNMGAVRAIQRETVPFGWQVTKQNHLLAASLDLNAFRASAMKAINKGELGVFNNDMRQVEADLKTYLGNHRNGLPGEAGIGQAKRDMLNGLIGTGTAVQRAANPLYYELNPKGSIRTWRVDRLNDAKPTGRTGYFFDYDKINNNRMPQALPREAMGMPDVPANLTTDQILRELEENQGYLGLSTLGMREGRPVKGGAQRTRELLKRNTALNEELRRRGGPQEESDVERVLRQRGQAMPDATELWHGGRDIAQGDGPVFLGSKRMAQSYAKSKGGKLQKVNAGDLRFAAAEEVERVLRDDGRISVPDTTMEPLFYTLDPAYSPARSKVAIEALQEAGYDGAILPIDSFAENLSNPSSSKKMEQSYMVFDRKSLQQPTTGRTRGQAMPDVDPLPRPPKYAKNAPIKVDGGKFINQQIVKSSSSATKNILDTNPQAFFDRIGVAAQKIINDPARMADPNGYLEYMRDAGVWGDVLYSPPTLREIINSPQRYVDNLLGGYHGDRTKPGTMEAADAGLDATVRMREAIGAKPPPLVTALHHFWGILSRMLPPVEQESGWLRLISRPRILEQIQKSIDGEYTLQSEDWKRLVQSELRESNSYAKGRGNQATANANAFHGMLSKWNGQWDRVSDVYATDNAIEAGRRFWSLGLGSVGIRNKVQRFIGLTYGIPGLIMDRWKFVEFYYPQFGKGPQEYFKYSATGTPEDPMGIYGQYGTIEAGNPNFSLAFYEGMEIALQRAIENSPELQQVLGRHANVGGMHWKGWNAIKNEAVGHSSLDITYDLVRANPNPTPETLLQLLRNKEYYTEGLVGNRIERFTLPLAK